MGAGKYIQETFEKEMAGKKDANYNYKAIKRERLLQYRKEKSAVVRVEKPTNPPKAHALGYKAKKGFLIARVRIRKGGGKHERARSRRKPKKQGIEKLTMKKNIQTIAEGRASDKFKNCEVLNSYLVGEDGKHKYFEVILVDTSAPEIIADKTINWICSNKQKGRVERGLTSAGKKARALRGKGKGYEKARPSAAAHGNRLK
ncbi:MAG: 50S ribosomal protein L15e [Candidatus Diapherotrites archaeon]